MDQVEEQFHLRLRERQVERILAAPADHKVCEQCRSVSKLATRICPVCHAYRWELDVNLVVETAKNISTRPFPVTAAVVPRL